MSSTDLNKGMEQLLQNLFIPRDEIFLEYHILLVSVDDLLARLLNSSGDK